MAQRKSAKPTRYVIDSTPHTAVVRCTRCPWRGLAHTKPSAYRLVAAHLDRAHADHAAADDARRAAAKHGKHRAHFGTTGPVDESLSA